MHGLASWSNLELGHHTTDEVTQHCQGISSNGWSPRLTMNSANTLMTSRNTAKA
jgi:hypothetical protein